MNKLIIFDCDGTLVDSEIIACRVFPAVWQNMGLTMSAQYFVENFVGVSNDSDIVKANMAKLPKNAMDIADAKFEEVLSAELRSIAGIDKLLGDLKCSTCVASNSSLVYLSKVLTQTGLKTFFEGRIFSSKCMGQPKPAPDVFLRAATQLGYASKNCYVVEDSVSGIQAAKNAGMTVIGFMGGLHFGVSQSICDKLIAAKADFYLKSTIELREFFTERGLM